MHTHEPDWSNKTPRFIFPKSARLLKTDDYSSVFSLKQSIRSRHFFLHYAPQEKELSEARPQARLGFIVAKRVLPRAVDRNLIRRLAKEAFRHLLPSFPAVDCVLRLHVRLSFIDRARIAKEITSLLQALSKQSP